MLALRQLTVHAPTAIYPHVGTALDLLWKPLTYHTSQVRFAATDALYALLVLVAPRASRFLQSIHISLFAGAVTAVEREAHDRASAHGGLLALTCLVRVATPEFILREDNLPQDRGGSGGGGTSGASALFGGSPSASSKQPRQHRLPPNSCFTFAWTAGSQHLMQRRNPELTRTALRLVVDLVRIAPAVFVAHCLPDCIRLLSDMLRDQRCKLRAEAFVTHAAIVHSLGAAYLRPHVAVLLASLREALIRGVRSRLYCEEALLSLTAIALAFGEEVTLQLQPLLRPTLNLPLSPAKLEALHALATSIPSLEEAVREKVLDILTSVLTRGTTWSEIVAGEFGESHDGSDAEPLSDEEAFLAAGPGGALIGMPTTSTSPGASPGGSPVQSPNASPAMLRRERDSSEAPGASPFWSRSARAIVPPAADADGSEQAERDEDAVREPHFPAPRPPAMLDRSVMPFAGKRGGTPPDVDSPDTPPPPPSSFGPLGGGEWFSPRPLQSHYLSGVRAAAHWPAPGERPLSPLGNVPAPAAAQRDATTPTPPLSPAIGRYAATPTLPTHLTAHHRQPSPSPSPMSSLAHSDGSGTPDGSGTHGEDLFFDGEFSSPEVAGLSSWLAPFAKSLLSDPREVARVGLLLSPSGSCIATSNARRVLQSNAMTGDSEPAGQRAAAPPVEPQDAELALALSAFPTYVQREEPSHVLHFLDRRISPLLFHASPAVRLESALLATLLLAPNGSAMRTEGSLGALASQVLSQVVSLCVGDPDEAIRLRVLEELDSRFLHVLADPLLLRPLSTTLHDASLSVRLRGIFLIGSLAAQNPAVANPVMRKALLTLLSQLRSSNESMHSAIARRAHHESATLLTAVERHAPRLARTYCVQILHALLPLLRTDAPPHTATAATYTVAELLTIAGPLLEPYAGNLLTLFLAGMKHRGTPGRRRAALCALERLVSCRGPAILYPSPYEHSALLFPTLMSMLATEQDEVTRGSVVRVIGLLGALEPLQYRVATTNAVASNGNASRQGAARDAVSAGEANGPGALHAAAAQTAAGGAGVGAAHGAPTEAPTDVKATRERADSTENAQRNKTSHDGKTEGATTRNRPDVSRRWGDDLLPSSPQYLPTIALRELMAILHDASLSAYHHRLIAALVYIFTALGDTCAPFSRA